MKDKEATILQGRFLDLANKSYNQNIFTFTDFLGLSEQSAFFNIKKTLEKSLPQVGITRFGGAKDTERVMIRFGDAESFGYEVPFPISCMLISPQSEKFSEGLSHRDVLGALMNLGIERSLLGDIIFSKEGIFLFCKESICDFLKENLFKIRHTSVYVDNYTGDLVNAAPNLVATNIQVASERLDAILSKVFKFSREESLSYFRTGRVFVNGREATGNSTKPKTGDIISLRGFGRFRYNGLLKETKKGNLVVEVLLFK